MSDWRPHRGTPRQSWRDRKVEVIHEPVRTFKNYCTCGGFAWQMNGRPESEPHMDWCPQREEYAAWYAKRNKDSTRNPD